jgi:hypothetical protein
MTIRTAVASTALALAVVTGSSLVAEAAPNISTTPIAVATLITPPPTPNGSGGWGPVGQFVTHLFTTLFTPTGGGGFGGGGGQG